MKFDLKSFFWHSGRDPVCAAIAHLQVARTGLPIKTYFAAQDYDLEADSRHIFL